MNFFDFFRGLNDRQLDYVVIGGVALVMHGVVRMTADLDLMVAMERGNLQKLIDVMTGLGYRPRIPEPATALLDPEKRKYWREKKHMEVFSFYAPDNPLALVDIMIYEPVSYPLIRQHAVTMKLGSIAVPVASIDDLIALKKISARPQDLEDIKSLEELKRHGQP